MTFADFALFAIAHDHMKESYGLTVAFTSRVSRWTESW